jgi:hypothetical protein
MASVDPFDMEEGANFKLRIVRVDNYPNYDKSSFDSPTAIEPKLIEKIQLFSLNEILDPKHFKSYADLEKRFNTVAAGAIPDEVANEAAGESKPSLDDDMPVATPKPQHTAAPKTARTTTPKSIPSVAMPEDDEDYFAKLAANAAESK